MWKLRSRFKPSLIDTVYIFLSMDVLPFPQRKPRSTTTLDISLQRRYFAFHDRFEEVPLLIVTPILHIMVMLQFSRTNSRSTIFMLGGWEHCPTLFRTQHLIYLMWFSLPHLRCLLTQIGITPLNHHTPYTFALLEEFALLHKNQDQSKMSWLLIII